MGIMKKLLVIGEYNALYHPLSALEEQLKSILSDEFVLEFTENYNNLDYNELKNYQAIISYTDCWDNGPSTGFAAALQCYIITGGSLLVIHNGISLQKKYEMAQMIGAKFMGHPERTNLRYTDFNQEHPIMNGITEFSLYEEPYQFEFDPFVEKTVLFYYTYEDTQYTAAWAHNYGKGNIVYLSPGHDSSIFECTEFRKIIRNSVNWLVR
jgi:type 1 glutamine amidotransferase